MDILPNIGQNFEISDLANRLRFTNSIKKLANNNMAVETSLSAIMQYTDCVASLLH